LKGLQYMDENGHVPFKGTVGGQHRNHGHYSADIVRPMLKGLGFGENIINDVVWLVDNHVIFRRLPWKSYEERRRLFEHKYYHLLIALTEMDMSTGMSLGRDVEAMAKNRALRGEFINEMETRVPAPDEVLYYPLNTGSYSEAVDRHRAGIPCQEKYKRYFKEDGTPALYAHVCTAVPMPKEVMESELIVAAIGELRGLLPREKMPLVDVPHASLNPAAKEYNLCGNEDFTRVRVDMIKGYVENEIIPRYRNLLPFKIRLTGLSIMPANGRVAFTAETDSRRVAGNEVYDFFALNLNSYRQDITAEEFTQIEQYVQSWRDLPMGEFQVTRIPVTINLDVVYKDKFLAGYYDLVENRFVWNEEYFDAEGNYKAGSLDETLVERDAAGVAERPDGGMKLLSVNPAGAVLGMLGLGWLFSWMKSLVVADPLTAGIAVFIGLGICIGIIQRSALPVRYWEWRLRSEKGYGKWDFRIDLDYYKEFEYFAGLIGETGYHYEDLIGRILEDALMLVMGTVYVIMNRMLRYILGTKSLAIRMILKRRGISYVEEKALVFDNDEEISYALVHALAKVCDASSTRFFIRMLRSPFPNICVISLRALGSIGDRNVLPDILEMLGHSNFSVRIEAKNVARKIGVSDRQMSNGYCEILGISIAGDTKEGSRSDQVNMERPLSEAQSDALSGLIKMAPAKTNQYDMLVGVLKSRYSGVREMIVRYLGKLDDARVVSCLTGCLCDPSPAVREAAAGVLKSRHALTRDLDIIRYRNDLRCADYVICRTAAIALKGYGVLKEEVASLAIQNPSFLKKMSVVWIVEQVQRALGGLDSQTVDALRNGAGGKTLSAIIEDRANEAANSISIGEDFNVRLDRREEVVPESPWTLHHTKIIGPEGEIWDTEYDETGGTPAHTKHYAYLIINKKDSEPLRSSSPRVAIPAGAVECANAARAQVIETGNALIQNLNRAGLLSDMDAAELNEMMPTSQMSLVLERAIQRARVSDAALTDEERQAVQFLADNLDRFEADAIMVCLIALMRKAERANDKLVIMLETDWIPGIQNTKSHQRAAIGTLLREMGPLFGKINGVEVVHKDSDEFMNAWITRAETFMTDTEDFSNVIILGSKGSIGYIRNNVTSLLSVDKKPLLAEINTKLFDDYYKSHSIDSISEQLYMQIMEMLLITLEVAVRNPSDKPNHPLVDDYDPSNRIIYFLPLAEEMAYQLLRDRYEGKLKALRSA
ncbi:MAG: HEAT repeat domain-containing protein, partial [Candidatus Omnitrophota bacterium]